MSTEFAEKRMPGDGYSWRSNEGPFWKDIKAGLTPGEEWKDLDVELFGDVLQLRASRSHVTKSGRLTGETVFIRLDQSEARRLLKWLKNNIEATP